MNRHIRLALSVCGVAVLCASNLFFHGGTRNDSDIISDNHDARRDRLVEVLGADLIHQRAAALLQQEQPTTPQTTHVANLVEQLLFHSPDLGKNTLISSSLPKGTIQKMVQFWNPCTLHQTLQQQQQQEEAKTRGGNKNNSTLRIVFVGGSATARTANQCSAAVQDGEKGGRYSDLLERKIQEDLSSVPFSYSDHHFPRFEAINVGHGEADTLWSALMLDQLVDNQNTDILVWEFAINDSRALYVYGGKHLSNSLEAMEAQMDVWLWRLSRHFDVDGQPPPPLILLYLWDFDVTTQLKEKTYIPQRAFQSHMKRLINHYRRSFGWSISVINVGGLVDPTYVRQNRQILLDDKVHPSCYCEHLISGLLRLVLYSDLLSCSTTPQHLSSSTTNAQSSHLKTLTMKPLLSNDLREEEEGIHSYDEDHHLPLKALLEDDIVVGSKMEWQPKLQYSNLLLTSNAHLFRRPEIGSKVFPGREDRKCNYRLPSCPETLSLVVENPNLEWIGVTLLRHYSVNFRLDGVNVNLTQSKLQNSISFDTKGRVGVWIPISSKVNKTHEKKQHNLTFCNDRMDGPNTRLSWIVGLFRGPSPKTVIGSSTSDSLDTVRGC